MSARTLYAAFLYYIVFEGALRKWVLPSLTNELFLLKDLLLFGALFALMYEERSRLARCYHFSPLESGIWQLWILVTLSGFALTGLSLSGIAGLRYYVAVLPILLLQPHFTPDAKSLHDFFSRYAAVAVGVCVLGFIQFVSPPTSLINAYSWSPGSDMDVATFGEVSDRGLLSSGGVRITGTFPYISPYVAYLQFMAFACLALLIGARTDRRRLFYGLALLLVMANLLMTGSRGPVLVTFLLSLFFAPELVRMLKQRSLGFTVTLAAFTLLIAGWVLLDLLAVLAERNVSAGDMEERVSGALLMPFYTIMNSPWIGDGVGATFIGMRQLTGVGANDMKHDEIFQDRLGIEVGIIGYVIFLFAKLYFLGSALVLVTRARELETRVWALACFAYQASLMWTIPLYNAVASTFYFVSIAIVAMLRTANTPESFRRRAPGRIMSRNGRAAR